MSTTTGTHFGASATECVCTISVSDSTPYNVASIYLHADNETAGIPYQAYAVMPWHTSEEPVTTSDGAGTWWQAFNGMDGTEFAYSPVNLAADDWVVYLRGTEADGDPVSCTGMEADGLTLTVFGATTSTGAPPPMPVNPLDIDEDDLVCAAGSPATTVFQLVDVPGWDHPVPVGISGERQHMLSKMDSVTVTDWHGADRLKIIGQDGATVTLTPSSPSATLSGGTWWTGSAQWWGSRLDSAGTWTNPTVSVTHSCPASVGSTTRLVDQGYALTLTAINDAIDTATGTTGLGDLMLSSSQPGWPVYVARVFPIGGGPLPGGQSHVLTVEVQGTQAITSIPITQTSPNNWSVDHAGDGWSVQGTVQRVPNKLIVNLSDGLVGTLDLAPVTVELPEYPDDGQ